MQGPKKCLVCVYVRSATPLEETRAKKCVAGDKGRFVKKKLSVVCVRVGGRGGGGRYDACGREGYN